VDTVPATVATGLSDADAARIGRLLESAGATVEIRALTRRPALQRTTCSAATLNPIAARSIISLALLSLSAHALTSKVTIYGWSTSQLLLRLLDIQVCLLDAIIHTPKPP
jgi:hypothetical protein